MGKIDETKKKKNTTKDNVEIREEKKISEDRFNPRSQQNIEYKQLALRVLITVCEGVTEVALQCLRF